MNQHLGTYREAYKRLSDPYACLKALTITRHVNLLPMYMNQLRTGIKLELDQELNLYSDELGGVLIAYDNIRRLQSGARIFEEQPFLHFDIKVDVIIFQPQVGSKLRGEVNKINYETSVGCLVHNCFNASVFKPRHMDTEKWEGSKLVIGDYFEFEVVKIFSNNRVLSMKGSIPQGSLVILDKTPVKVLTIEDQGEAETPRREKKKKEKKGKKEKKHKKKSKEISEEHKKESKKRKADLESEEDSEGLMPSPKKRKHRKSSEFVRDFNMELTSTPVIPGPSTMGSPLARQKIINEQSLSLIASIGALGKVPVKRKFSSISPNGSDSGVSSLMSSMEDKNRHSSKKKKKKSREESNGEQGEPTKFLSQDSELSRVISSEETSRGSQDATGGDFTNSASFGALESVSVDVQPASGSSCVSSQFLGKSSDITASAKKHKKKKSKEKDKKSMGDDSLCVLTPDDKKHSHKHKKRAR